MKALGMFSQVVILEWIIREDICRIKHMPTWIKTGIWLFIWLYLGSVLFTFVCSLYEYFQKGMWYLALTPELQWGKKLPMAVFPMHVDFQDFCFVMHIQKRGHFRLLLLFLLPQVYWCCSFIQIITYITNKLIINYVQ